jgi:chorismate dehydratase
VAINVGEITYTNILPLYYYVDRNKLAKNDISFIPQVPSHLNLAMKKGDIDIGAISSFAYGENYREYDLLPDLSVSANGKVGSIFLFSKVPIEQLDGSSIALTSSSATSVHLLKIILKEFYTINVNYETVQPEIDAMLKTNNACLLIGDDAIQAMWEKADENLYIYDLGELWTKFTNLPITFAVVAVRKEIVKTERASVSLLLEELTHSKTLSLKSGFLPMIKEIKMNHHGSYRFWENYFAGLDYHFQEKQFRGLQHYYELCYKHGFIEQVPKLSFVNDYAHTHSM